MKASRLRSRLVIAADDEEKDKEKKEKKPSGDEEDAGGKKDKKPDFKKKDNKKEGKDDAGDGEDDGDKDGEGDERSTGDAAKDPHENNGPVEGHNENLAPMGVIKMAFACMQEATKAKPLKLKLIGRSQVFSYPSSVNPQVFLEHFGKMLHMAMEKEFERSPNMNAEVNVYKKVFVLPSKGRLNVVEGCYDDNHIFMILFVPGGVIFSYDERAES